MEFLAERLKVQMREKRAPRRVDAVFSLGGEDDLVRLLARVEAVQSFLAPSRQESAHRLRPGAISSRRGEEGQDARAKIARCADAHCWNNPRRKPLLLLCTTSSTRSGRRSSGGFRRRDEAFAGLRAPIDAFFEKVTVNVQTNPICD